MIDFDQLATSCVNPYDMKNMYEYCLRILFYFSMIKPAVRLFSNLTNWLFKSYRNLLIYP